RVEPRCPRADVEFPCVPGAAQDLARALVGVRARSVGGDCADLNAGAERTALVRAAVADGEVGAGDVEDANRATVDIDELAGAGRDLVGARDDDPSHSRRP